MHILPSGCMLNKHSRKSIILGGGKYVATNCVCAWWYCIGTLRRSADVYLCLFNISFKRLNHCDDLQSSFSSECRITHQILSVFTSIFKAVLNFFGWNSPQTLLKCQISPSCLDTLPPSCFLRFFRAPSASIQPVNETQLDHFSPRHASSSNHGLWRLLYLCQEVYFRPRWRAAAEPQLSECWGESWVMLSIPILWKQMGKVTLGATPDHLPNFTAPAGFPWNTKRKPFQEGN